MADITLEGAWFAALRTPSKTPAEKGRAEVDPEVAKRLAQTREEADRIIDTLKRSKTDLAGRRRQAAKERVDQIKKALQALKMVGGDPKQLAKEAARLARELAAAVKEYAAAGGKDAGAAEAAGPPADSAAQAAKGDAGEADALPAGGGVPADAAAPAPARAADRNAEPAVPGRPAEERKAEDDGKRPGATAGKEDDGFVGEVRELVKKLKAFLVRQRDRMGELPGQAGDGVIKGALDDLRKVERLLDNLPSAGASAVAPVNVVV